MIPNLFYGRLLNVDHASLGTALDKPEHHALVTAARLSAFRIGRCTRPFERARRLALTVIGFVGFHDLAAAAHWFGLRILHCFTNAMEHEPSRAIGAEAKGS